MTPERKTDARRAVREALGAGRRMMVRINGCETPWCGPDLEALVGLDLGGLVVPKTEDPRLIETLSDRFPGVPILSLIETGCGFAKAGEIAAAAGVERLVFGTIDSQLDLGISGEGDELLYFRSSLVLQSRLARIGRPVDGVSSSFDGPALSAEAARAKRVGLRRQALHPSSAGGGGGAGVSPDQGRV